MCYLCHPPIFFPAFIHSQCRHLLHSSSVDINTWVPSSLFIHPAFVMPYECYVPTCILFSYITCSDITTYHWGRWIYTMGTLPLGDIATLGNVASCMLRVHILDCRAWCHLVPPGYMLPLPDENSYNSTWQFRMWCVTVLECLVMSSYLLTDDWLVYAVPRLTTVVP